MLRAGQVQWLRDARPRPQHEVRVEGLHGDLGPSEDHSVYCRKSSGLPFLPSGTVRRYFRSIICCQELGKLPTWSKYFSGKPRSSAGLNGSPGCPARVGICRGADAAGGALAGPRGAGAGAAGAASSCGAGLASGSPGFRRQPATAIIRMRIQRINLQHQRCRRSALRASGRTPYWSDTPSPG